MPGKGASGTKSGGRAGRLAEIADRVACDRFRRKKPESTLGDSVWEIGDRAAEANDPSRTAAHNEAAGRLDEGAGGIDAVATTGLAAAILRPAQFNEIAKTLDCPLNTARATAIAGCKCCDSISGR